MSGNLKKLSVAELDFSIPPKKIRELKKLKSRSPIIGQERAVSAIQLGLNIESEGFNIFVMGASGTGRRTVLNELLKDFKPNKDEIQDIAYVYNFAKKFEPKALFFPAGKGAEFKGDLKQSINDIAKASLQLVNSESYLTAQKKLIAKNTGVESTMLAEFETKMIGEGFKLIQSKDPNDPSVDLVPLIEGKEVDFNQIQSAVAQGKFPKKNLEKIRKRYFTGLEEMSALFETLRNKREETEQKLDLLLTDSVKPIIETKLKPVFDLAKGFDNVNAKNKKQKENTKNILAFLKTAQDDLVSKVGIYTRPFKNAGQKKAFFSRYAINLVCEHNDNKNYVVTENLPNFANLFGTIENSLTGAHLKICPGAVHKAFGGYLILRLQDLLTEEDSWFYLKRILQSGTIEIQNPPSSNNSTNVFKPEPLPAHFKVILVGGENSYDILYQEDPDFHKLFKVCAEFDSVMLMSDKNMAALLSLADEICKNANILKFTDSGYADLIVYASKLAESRHLITTRFTKISDLITKANFIAKEKGVSKINSEILEETINHNDYLNSLIEEKFNESLKLKETLLQVSGKKTGNINGLAVQDRGYYAFGTPVTISAQASPGNAGIINIESESGLSGEIYYKAHLIISSLLRKKYTQDFPLSIEATLCFEQSYGLIEGDSASCAEFLALLSAIAQIPLRQDIAITGSLNQHGEVQPVGGVNEKIAGFFNTCEILGFTGTQGVIIPESNKNNIFLSKKILQAVKQNRFSIWTIKDIDDAIEILSGITLTEFNNAITEKLKSFNEKIKEKICLNKDML